MIRQYRTFEFGDAKREIISQDLSDTIYEWLDVFVPNASIKPVTVIPEWQPDTESVELKPREIHIRQEYLPYIAAKLKPYFSEDDFKILPSLLEGKEGIVEVIFLKGASMLGYFLKQMHDRKIIVSDKKDTEKWLADHFKFVNRKENYAVTPFKISVAHKYLTLETKLKGKTIIDISDLTAFENKNNLK